MRDDEPRLMLEETGKHGNLQTYCGGEESLPERWVKGVVGARGADGPEPGERFPEQVAGLGVVGCVCVLLLQDLLQSCSRAPPIRASQREGLIPGPVCQY